MKVDVTQGLTALDGEPLENEDQEPIVLRTVAINALMGVMEGDNSMTGEQKLKNWVLAQRLQKEDSPDLTPEELASIKERIGKAFGPAVVGPSFVILNGSPAEG